jgi:hypothetical protein
VHWVRGCGGAGFSLWGFVLAMTKPHRLKPTPQNTKFQPALFHPKNEGFFSFFILVRKPCKDSNLYSCLQGKMGTE